MTSGTRAPIAVICALDDELLHLRAALPPGREEWRGSRGAWCTELDGQPIVLALCGIGMISAAAVTEWLVGAVSAVRRPQLRLHRRPPSATCCRATW